MKRLPRSAALLPCVALLLLISCGNGNGNGETQLAPLPRPDLNMLDASANFPIEERQSLETAAQSGTNQDKAAAYGRLGMLYHAYKLYQPAQICYANARKLDTTDSRWLYLMGCLHRLLGEPDKAMSALSETVLLDPENASAMVLLGDLNFLDNKLEKAEELFGNAVRLESDLTAAYIGLGKIAAARTDYRKAIEMYQKALAREPEATVVHYLLAMAWRGLGNDDKAKEHMALRGEGQPALADPILAEVELLRNDADAMRQRGNRAAAEKRYAEALQFYSEALRGTPKDPRIWINVGLCQQELGNAKQAMEAYQQVIELAKLPALTATAHFRLGALLDMQNLSGAAHYEAAVALTPDNLAAVFRHAESLRGARRFEESLPWYQKTIETRADHGAARLGRSLSLISLGRWQEARKALEQDMTALTDQPAFAHLLARIMAAGPDKSVRNGNQAIAIINSLSAVMTGSDLEATRAMALAELGRFDEALVAQQKAVGLAVSEGRPVEFHQKLLLTFKKKKPCRQPWPPSDPLFIRRNY